MLAHARPDGCGTGRSAHGVGDGFAQGGYEGVRELRGRRTVDDPAEGGGGDDLFGAAARRRDDRAVAEGCLEDGGGQAFGVHGWVDEYVGAAVEAHDAGEVEFAEERDCGV